MAEVMTVWNKGKRTWTLKDASGNPVRLQPNESIDMEADRAAKLVEAYHRDFSLSKSSGPSTTDLARREQSLKDREAALAKKIADFEARAKEPREMTLPELIAAITPYLSDEAVAYLSEVDCAWKTEQELAEHEAHEAENAPKKRGRKPKAE